MDTIWAPDLSDYAGAKYQKVVAALREGISSGALAVGVKLPPVRELAWQLSITPGTVARAYTILTEEGVLEAAVGRGTFVAAAKTPILDDVWSRETKVLLGDTEGDISLFSPRMPDMGQIEALRAACREMADMDPLKFLNYPTRDAYRPVRQVVLDWLSDLHLGQLRESDIVLTHGGQSSICVVMQAILSGPRPVLFVEELSYAGFRRAAELMRAEVVAVEMDEHGMRADALERMARNHIGQAICLTPEVQNPTGGFMPLERRKELIRVCERHDLQIIEDDCYRMGSARAQAFRALAPDRSWHVSSISKSLTPALRIGWALAPQGRSSDLRRAAEYGYFGVAQPVAELTRILLGDPGVKQLADRIRARMGEYVRAAVNVLGRYDLSWDAEVPFLWLNLPSGWRAAAFCRAAEREGVQIRSADEFCLRDGRAPHAVRFAVNGHISLDRFEEAMQRLRRLLDNPPEQISV